jgi:hypothetical protein
MLSVCPWQTQGAKPVSMSMENLRDYLKKAQLIKQFGHSKNIPKFGMF